MRDENSRDGSENPPRTTLGLTFNSSLKYGLHADNTTRWAFRLFPSHANVTSIKSSSSRKFSNAVVMLF